MDFIFRKIPAFLLEKQKQVAVAMARRISKIV
jgi:hypothetical protein